jgi:hypothetical protein
MQNRIISNMVNPANPAETTYTPEVERASGSALKFVFWDHIPENAAAAAERLKDCDVIGDEMLGFRNQSQRHYYDAAATTYISSTATSWQRRKAGWYIRNYGTDCCLSFLDELRGTDKRVVTLDIDKCDPEYAAYKDTLRAQRKVHTATKQHRLSCELRPLLLNYLGSCAVESAVRESCVVPQIHELVDRYGGRDTKVGILYGAIHTPLYHAMSSMYPSESVFVALNHARLFRNERRHFAPEYDIIRRLRFLSDANIPETLVNRAILQNEYTHDIVNPNELEVTSHVRLLEKMSAAELVEAIAMIDGLKIAVNQKNIRQRWQTRVKIIDFLEAKFSELEQR